MAHKLEVQRAVLDWSAFPLVVLTELGPLSDKDRVTITEGLDELIDQRERHAVVLDLTRGVAMPPEQQMYVAETFFQMRDELIVEKWACLGVVVGTPVIKHMPLANFWLKGTPVPSKLFPKLSEATGWASGLVAQRHSLEMRPQSFAPGKLRPAR